MPATIVFGAGTHGNAYYYLLHFLNNAKTGNAQVRF